MHRTEVAALRRLLADRAYDGVSDDLRSIASSAREIDSLLRTVPLSAKQRRVVLSHLERIANEMTMAWQFLDDRRPGRG